MQQIRVLLRALMQCKLLCACARIVRSGLVRVRMCMHHFEQIYIHAWRDFNTFGHESTPALLEEDGYDG